MQILLSLTVAIIATSRIKFWGVEAWGLPAILVSILIFVHADSLLPPLVAGSPLRADSAVQALGGEGGAAAAQAFAAGEEERAAGAAQGKSGRQPGYAPAGRKVAGRAKRGEAAGAAPKRETDGDEPPTYPPSGPRQAGRWE